MVSRSPIGWEFRPYENLGTCAQLHFVQTKLSTNQRPGHFSYWLVSLPGTDGRRIDDPRRSSSAHGSGTSSRDPEQQTPRWQTCPWGFSPSTWYCRWRSSLSWKQPESTPPQVLPCPLSTTRKASCGTQFVCLFVWVAALPLLSKQGASEVKDTCLHSQHHLVSVYLVGDSILNDLEGDV